MDDKTFENTVPAENPDKSTRDAPSTTGDVAEPQGKLEQSALRQDGPALTGESTQGKDAAALPLEEGQKSTAESSETTSTPASNTSTQNYVPPVKRFNSVNINKKFLQKNQAATSLSASGASASSSSKQSSSLVRPSPQSVHSNSRLVTAKLSASSTSTSPAPGWSRPNSVPPQAASPSNAPGLQKNGTPPAQGQSAPSGGKLISSQASGSSKLDTSLGSARPAWRNIQPVVGSLTIAENEFPTAAEAVKGVVPKPSGTPSARQIIEAHEQARKTEARSFRAPHLASTAHQWADELTEDNSDFLEDVIAFGDGRQYTVEPGDSVKTDVIAESEVPVSKQERFPDDFDRSWPRSRPNITTSLHDGLGHRDDLERRSRASETSSNHSPISRHDGSRVLFNERSNRMEPYSSTKPVQSSGQGTFLRRGSDTPGGHVNNRLERDAPPHSNHAPFQVLQKTRSQIDSLDESRQQLHPGGHREHSVKEDSLASQSPTESVFEQRKGRHNFRQSPVANVAQLANGRPTARSPSAARSVTNGVITDGIHSSGRPSEPRSVPIAKEPDRQLPPHLRRVEEPPQEGHTSGSDHQKFLRSPVASRHGSSIDGESAPEEHHKPSRGAITGAKAQLPSADDEVLRKAYIAESVERARLRRQQEEEERAKASERARKKAEELAKLLAKSESPKTNSLQDNADSNVAPQLPTEAEVLTVIEEAVKHAASANIKSDPKSNSLRLEVDREFKPTSGGRTSSRDEYQSMSAKDAISRHASSVASSDQKGVWKDHVKSSLHTKEAEESNDSKPMHAILAGVQTFPEDIDGSMEVVDFSDMGRLVGEKPVPVTAVSSASEKPSRPVASDFLDQADEQGTESWRRVDHKAERVHFSQTKYNESQPEDASTSTGYLSKHGYSPKSVESSSVVNHKQLSRTQVPPQEPSAEHHVHSPGSPGATRSLRANHNAYREVPLSALDDTMSRIKGALDGMHSEHEVKSYAKDATHHVAPLLQSSHSTQSKHNKWLPPALRPHGATASRKSYEASIISLPQPPEKFAYSYSSPPVSPPPADDNFTVRIGKSVRTIEPVPRKKLQIFEKHGGPLRWEILSFNPPVEGMTKRALSVNDALFGKPPPLYKSRRFDVLLSHTTRVPVPLDTNMVPRVGVHVHTRQPKDSSVGAFGRPKGTDQSSWRSVTSSHVPDESVSPPEQQAVVSSPPPAPDSSRTVKIERTVSSSSTLNRKATEKSKRPSKSIDVDDVVFFKDNGKLLEVPDQRSNAPAMSFTVNSELESESNPIQSDASPSTKVSDGSPAKPDDIAPTPLKETVSAAADIVDPLPSQRETPSQLESPKGLDLRLQDQAANDPLLRKGVKTPPPANQLSSVWRSPGPIYPDPEHLKAVWSQPSDKETLPTTNSLKKFEDDLTAVPFTLQEVKSEGGTPPPSGPIAPPTRMSASEVTRAFQTVPSGPSNHIPTPPMRAGQSSAMIGSPLSNHRPLKPVAISLPQSNSRPVLNPPAPRPHYVGYPAINNHSPSPPTLMYPHMQAGLPSSPAASPYGQPMWMPVVQQGPPMIRAQPASPYNPSGMSYHVTGVPQNGVYTSQNNMAGAQNSHSAYPSPAPIMVSPVMPQATAVPSHMMYTGSPMLVPVASPGGPPPRPYSNATSGRPPMGSIESRPPISGHPSASAPRYPVHTPGFQPVHAQPFARPW